MGLLLTFLLMAMGISFLCSLLESVLMSTPISYITMREEEGDSNAKLFAKLKDDIDRPIAAILSLNTIANTIGAAGVGRQATIIFGSTWFGIISAIMTLLILVFAEIVPKTIGTSYWKHLMGFATRMISLLIVLMYPLVLLASLVGKILSKDEDEAAVSREEVTAMANIGVEEGVIDSDENKVIQNIMKLDNVPAYEAMTPRIVAVTAQENMMLKNFYKNDQYLHYSRIPVYGDSPEYITGYILL
jgi:CBS domain containing-hemolysin-like protein